MVVNINEINLENLYQPNYKKRQKKTGLTKKEKEEIINKRNCLLVQKHCYEEILEILK